MKLKAQQDLSCADIEIDIRYSERSSKVERIISYLQSIDRQIKCDIDGIEKMVDIADIYYIESVEKRTFVYFEKLVYHTNFRLYQLTEDLSKYGFAQISKSCILNINVLATTGISLSILSIVALCYNAECLYIKTVFEMLGINIVIHLCLLLLHQFELKNPVLEMTLEVLIVIVTSIVFGAIFQWFTSTPIWILIIMGVVIYVISLVLNAMTMKQEVQKINALIKKKNKY